MGNFWQEVGSNKVLWIVVLSGVIAQGLKIIRGVARKEKFSFSWLIDTGGMPSSHSAVVISFAVCMGKELGYASPFFALGILFAMITMFDAQTWRRSIGMQAKILNKMMDDLHEKKRIEENRLKELVGHTPVEVLMGALVGLIATFIFY
ncbi:MAG: divergent PAP2 family protein [Omnitrophica bacterium]|nr:divergent PAP2 family protein [Candidatus Omnitrophota bacterium]